MIVATNLSYTYPYNDTPALRELSFTIPEGSLACILGNNGSGKSTLLLILAGLFKPQGDLRILGHKFPEEAALARRQTAFLPQEPDLYILGSTLGEDLRLSLPPGDQAALARAEDLATRFGLAELMERPTHNLSHGEKRKLCLASALAAAPRLLLMDEPHAGLDAPGRLKLKHIIADNRAQGITQVIGTHDFNLLEDIADVRLILERGALIA